MDFKNAFDPDKNLFYNIDSLNDCKNYDVLSFNDSFKVVNKYNLNILSFKIRSFSKNSDEFLIFLDNINIKYTRGFIAFMKIKLAEELAYLLKVFFIVLSA